MAQPGPWRGDAIRRGLAKELGTDVADQLQALAEDVVEQADQIEGVRTRNNMLAFVALCIGGHMQEEPDAVGGS
jgi:hypothetical protein